MHPFLFFTLTFLVAILCPDIALAHASADDLTGGFLTGLLHPVLGLDHFLAMVAVGIISAQIGGRGIWSVPATFVTVMALGGLVGLYSESLFGFEIAMFMIEQGIILSVIVLGLAIALNTSTPVLFAMVGVALFGFFHGYAHGNEFPGFDIPWLYVAGFMTGTASLHILGVLIGLTSGRFNHGSAILRHAGSAMLGMGLLMQIDYIQSSYFWITLWEGVPE
jgi:urease accessory protein